MWSALSPSFLCCDLLVVSHQTFQPMEKLRVQTSRLSLQTLSDIPTTHPCLKPGFISMEDWLGHGEWEGNESRNQEGRLLQQTTCRFSVNVWSAFRTMVPVSGDTRLLCAWLWRRAHHLLTSQPKACDRQRGVLKMCLVVLTHIAGHTALKDTWIWFKVRPWKGLILAYTPALLILIGLCLTLFFSL